MRERGIRWFVVGLCALVILVLLVGRSSASGEGVAVWGEIVLVANETYTVMEFENVFWDDAGFYDVGEPSRLTVPEGMAGWYSISSVAKWYGGSPECMRAVYLRAYGDTYIGCEKFVGWGGGVHTSVETVWYLDDGEYVETVCYQDSGDELGQGGGQPHAYGREFRMVRLSGPPDDWVISSPISVGGVLSDTMVLSYDSSVDAWVNKYIGGVKMPISELDQYYLLAGFFMALLVGAACRQQTVALLGYLAVVVAGCWREPIALNGLLILILAGSIFSKFVGGALR